LTKRVLVDDCVREDADVFDLDLDEVTRPHPERRVSRVPYALRRAESHKIARF
jgi:hypothetical protein